MSTEADQSLRQLKVYKGLVEVSALINAITDFNELLAAILDVSRRVMFAEASSLFLTNADGNLELVVASGAGAGETPKEKIVVPRGQGIAGWVLENKTSALVKDAYADPRFYQGVDKKTGFRTRSILCVPLSRNQHEIGVLQVLNPVEKESFDENDVEAFEAYGTFAATAIEKLRIIDQQRKQERMEQEFSFAREIQNSFLPQSLPSLGALSFAATYRPALNIGGDFYDVLEIGPDEVYFVIGDVSGKGIPAALLMAQALNTLRLIVKSGISPADALARWNGMLCGHTIRGMFITSLLGRIVPSQRLVEMASAGHCQPFLALAGGGVIQLDVKSAPPIGILDGLQYHLTSTTLSPNDWLIFYTDGLTESFSPDNTLLESEGVERILSAQPLASADDVLAKLRTGEENHRQNADPHDDLTILVFGFQ